MASPLLLSTWLDEQDGQFLNGLRACDDDRALAVLADRIVKDQRPWIRGQLQGYLDLPLDRPGHHPFVKRTFKHFEAAGDTEVMASFLVAFDRLIRRRLITGNRWDWQSRMAVSFENLVLPRAVLLPKHAQRHPEAKTRTQSSWRSPPPGTLLFSKATRLHLRRRAWRFFRRLGHRQPDLYVAAISKALERYTDADLQAGQDLLESWGLVHALFAKSPVLEIKGTWINLAKGRTLAELAAAPKFPALWQAAEARSPLLHLATHARSKLVRTWSQDWLRTHHAEALKQIPVQELRILLDSDWEDVRLFGVDLFRNHPDLPRLTVAEWLALTALKDASILDPIVQAMRDHVRGSRLSHDDAIRLACHRAVTVCRLGLSFMAEKSWDTPESQAALLGLSQVSCAAMSAELGTFLLARLGTPDRYRIDHALICLDHRLAGMRLAGTGWMDETPHARRDAVLWARLAETPHDDVRQWLVRALDRFCAEAQIAGDQRRLLWATVLLNIHRGSRTKLHALRQLSDALVDHPDEAPALLAVIAVALRSVRAPERRGALTALIGALVREPRLRPAFTQHLPDLDCSRITSEAG